MGEDITSTAAGRENARRLFVYNGGFLTQSRIKRILSLCGYDVRLGAPGPEDLVGVWGMSPTAHRGEAVAKRRQTAVVRVEDAWLRSLFPGRGGEPPIGLTIDETGVHYDASTPSDLENLLSDHPLDDTALLDRARGAVERLRETHVTKYSAVDTSLSPPAPGYVLVIDQTRDDASVKACGADRNRFLEMLFVAREEHPGARILIKTHPETDQGHREGYYSNEDLSENVAFVTGSFSPWVLLEGAVAVYTVSSQFGFEAIFAGHRPRVFGTPFYAGWGLTHDEFPVQRRQRTLSRAQLFAAAVLLYPQWYDPFTDRLCTFETALENMAAAARSWREDRHGWIASEMRLWKRPHLQKAFGRFKPVVFEDDPSHAREIGKPQMVWASKATDAHKDAHKVEDGFLRSRGLGAELVPPFSVVVDELGIYYDASGPSELERLIAARATLRPDQQRRAERLIRSILETGATKYNVGGTTPALPDGHRILVVGQVEDDASLKLGGGRVRTNAALIDAVRAAAPDAKLIYKPHPDVEAELRDGGDGGTQADFVAAQTDPNYLFEHVHEVWTMTSLMGFEALIRGLPVTTLGAPFYAGWELTNDLGDVPPRRRASPSLAGLVHATLIDYPLYFHPVTGTPCAVETILDWLSTDCDAPLQSRRLRWLSKIQGLFASKARFWRSP